MKSWGKANSLAVDGSLGGILNLGREIIDLEVSRQNSEELTAQLEIRRLRQAAKEDSAQLGITTVAPQSTGAASVQSPVSARTAWLKRALKFLVLSRRASSRR